MENAHDGHRERLRERIVRDGIETLHTHEVIEYLLYPAIPRRDTNPIAHALLERFGSMKAVFEADVDELASVEGMSESAARWLIDVGRAVCDYADAPDEFVPMHNHRETRLFVEKAFRNEDSFGNWLFCLNSFGNVIHCIRIDVEEEWFARRNMQLIISQALGCEANSILLLQKRMDTRLRDSDVQHTETLMNALSKVQIALVEHLIVDSTGKIVQRLLNPWVGNAGLAEMSPLLAHWLDEE